MTLSHIDGLVEDARARDLAFQMDEDLFRAFYERTSRGLAGYLVRLCGDRQQAADLLQETYYRFLRSEAVLENDAHRRNYLYRIATNLVRDTKRTARPVFDTAVEVDDVAARDTHGNTEARQDVRRALGKLKPRERAMLWLAYANGSSHAEIADVLGLKTGSIKLLLFRARRKMAAALQR